MIQKLIIFLLIFAICFSSGCTEKNVEENQKDDSIDDIEEVSESLENISLEEEDIDLKEECDCPKYDYNKEECLKHEECVWIKKEQLCECIDEIDDQEPELSDEKKVQFSKNWNTVIVDDTGWVGIDPWIEVDKNGNPHISYYDQGNRDVKYAYHDGSKWHIETVDSEGNVGEESSIDIDSKGNPHISYQDYTGRSLRYAKKENGKWHITKVDTLEYEIQGISTSIKLDSKDYPHIAYTFGIKNPQDTEDKFVRYAYFDGDRWNIDKIKKMGQDIILDLDSKDLPHVSFITGENDASLRINHATKINEKWEIEIVDDKTLAGGDTAIVVDFNDNIHISYHDYNKGSVRYAYRDKNSWKTQLVADDVGSIEGLKLNYDNKNRPHLIYSKESSSNKDDSDNQMALLEYAFLSDNTWTKEIVHRMGNPSITIDSLGRVHVAHTYAVDEDPLKYCPDYEGDEKEIEILKYSIRK